MPRTGCRALTAISLAALIALALTTATLAAPPAQSPILPTPTLRSINPVSYTLHPTSTFNMTHILTDNGNITLTLRYPRGMEFAIQPTSPHDEIESVTLIIQFLSGVHEPHSLTWDADRAAWIAHIWPTGAGIPAWTTFEFWFRFRETNGRETRTHTALATYVDPTRQWWRAESDDAILYWFGFGDDDPDQVAARVLAAIASTEPRRRVGFGQWLSYKPINVIYGSIDALSEIYGSGITDYGSAERFGATILAMPPATLDEQIEWLELIVPHEITHLYQFDTLGSATGPMWWAEGQANWFMTAPGEYDARLRHLATLQDLPTLTGPISLDLLQADGRVNLGYDMGASFINWLLAHYGGIATHTQIVALMQNGTNLYDAVESVTGEPFFEIENAWRIYLGAPPFTLADRDPASALEPLSEPIVAVGATITLPATPPMIMLYQDPLPNALVSGSCWANIEITILRAGSRDGVDYYEVDCMGQIGWVTEEQIQGKIAEGE